MEKVNKNLAQGLNQNQTKVSFYLTLMAATDSDDSSCSPSPTPGQPLTPTTILVPLSMQVSCLTCSQEALLPPPTSSSSSSLSKKLDTLWQENAHLKQQLQAKIPSRFLLENNLLKQKYTNVLDEVAMLKAQHDAAHTHVVFAGQQYSVYKHRYNEKSKKKDSSQKVSTSACILTSEQGKIEIEEDALQRADKKSANEERQKQRSNLLHANILQ
ncbi:hypothetical protein J3R30DRAFT_3705946 [Lentinula aciculospora]|uniref:Uncharacterized protein n=1 Tax=Lentinula aciculospora TaxID=153920 RepID=A0A9W9DM28_9AGAR|nr:hypothetical protein J3R30DRAFT_3705946 [Lentinula aciculospora]